MLLSAYYYYVNKIEFSLKNFWRFSPFFALIFFYVFFVPLLRSKNGFDNIISGRTSIVNELGVSDFFSNLSYTYIDVFTVNHFDKDNIWRFSSLGTIPSNLFQRNIPSEERPPIDEGMYFVSTIVRGKNYVPLIPRNHLREFSFPIENMGFGYANFLLLGVVLAFFGLGRFNVFLYKLMCNTNYSPFWFYLYLYSVFNFNFSSLRLMNMITTCSLLLFFYFIYTLTRVFYHGR
ncbi:hypothetical protein [Persicobacter sp. CCB-QB2]|uniref:hypothetical protein n=1 Tax=Persicobacter sp. CCB-QB2 TaxID=1561025 RepID=UPI0006A9BF11|nr:hypothetical protein [Persicobacter sp. CCB-QB2]